MEVTPLPKPRRLKDEAAIEAARLPYCEHCGSTWQIAVHHIRSRGAFGSDEPDNTVSLCRLCHTKAHNGQLRKETLREIVRRRGVKS